MTDVLTNGSDAERVICRSALVLRTDLWETCLLTGWEEEEDAELKASTVCVYKDWMVSQGEEARYSSLRKSTPPVNGKMGDKALVTEPMAAEPKLVLGREALEDL